MESSTGAAAGRILIITSKGLRQHRLPRRRRHHQQSVRLNGHGTPAPRSGSLRLACVDPRQPGEPRGSRAGQTIGPLTGGRAGTTNVAAGVFSCQFQTTRLHGPRFSYPNTTSVHTGQPKSPVDSHCKLGFTHNLEKVSRQGKLA